MTPAAPDAGSLFDALRTLRADGRHALDPVRFCYLETLARRLQDQPGAVQAHLRTTLQAALADYPQHSAQAPARPRTPPPTRHISPHRTGLDGLKALNLSMRAPQTGAAPSGDGGARHGVTEMKSVEQFRHAWGRMKVQDQVGRALAQCPVNAGPLNSHRLVLRTLGLMQDLSPGYMHHFMAHLDTLLRLDTLSLPQAAKPAKGSKTVAKKTSKSKSG